MDAAPIDRRHLAAVWIETLDPGVSSRTARSQLFTLDLLRHARDPFDRRAFDPGHVTASALVLCPYRTRVLLVFHKRLQRWLQPGGHVEPGDHDVVQTARRENLEETGVGLVVAHPILVGIDVHEIPAARAEPRHLHYDFMFGFIADSDVLPESPEARQVAWCPIDALARFGADKPLRRGVERALRSAA